MIFNYVSGIQDIDKKKVKTNYREAIRAIIFQGNSILMVHTNKGDYKFPGGGVNKGESHKETLEREVKEETGYLVNSVKSKIGVFIERNIDEYEENAIFQMTSYYYKCEISDNKTLQKLDDYEFELEFSPVWILIDEAIYLNEEILKKDNKHRNPWVYRETKVLKALKENNRN
jgi:8-oxo-dGTP pyrophosphatase MutT (NUDIX family)